MYWYKSRYFDPQCGRFTTRDPLGPWGDPFNLGNPYTYTGNNPWSYLDPYGLCGEYNDFSDEWWGDFWDAFYDLTIGDPFGYAGDSLDVLLGYGNRALELANDYGTPLGLLETAFDQLSGLYDMGQLAWNDPGALYNMGANGLSNWAEGWLDPYQGGRQAFDVAMMYAGARALGGYYANGGSSGLPSTSRFTQPGETYFHYGYGNQTGSFRGGIHRGGYATPNPNLSGPGAQSALNLPHGRTPPNAMYTIQPRPGTPIIGPRPVVGGTGYEVLFPHGTGPGTVTPPVAVPPVP